MNVGLGIFQGTDGKYYVSLAVVDGAVNVQATITNDDNYMHDINEMIKSLKQIQNDMRQIKSGLITVREVPDGLHPSATQGRPKRG